MTHSGRPVGSRSLGSGWVRGRTTGTAGSTLHLVGTPLASLCRPEQGGTPVPILVPLYEAHWLNRTWQPVWFRGTGGMCGGIQRGQIHAGFLEQSRTHGSAFKVKGIAHRSFYT